MPAPIKPAPEPPPEPLYPTIASFVEWATVEDVDSLFAPLKEQLKSMKGSRAAQAKRVAAAIARAEELLFHLLAVKERLQDQPSPAPRGRK